MPPETKLYYFLNGKSRFNSVPEHQFLVPMADHLTKAKRSWNMSRIKGKDTGPEKTVRSLLHRLGYRFSLRGSKLPGRPDIVMPKHETVVFVHGCFWHRHKNCKEATMPKSRTDWWRAKLEGNAARDKIKQREIRRLGWKVIVVWECETEKDQEKLTSRFLRLLKK